MKRALLLVIAAIAAIVLVGFTTVQTYDPSGADRHIVDIEMPGGG